jgi:hypothetical protein
LNDVRTNPEGRARHWLIDAAVGAGVALGMIGIAHAALPERTVRPTPARPATTPQAPVAQTAEAEPPTLIAFRNPVAGEEIVSPFGLRQLPWEEHGRLHEGVDIAADFGEPVLAAADGVVARAGESFSYGRFVEVKHAEGLTTLYAHMGRVAPQMRPGMALKAGVQVGQVGSSGTSTGPHLHFEIRDAKDRPLNPKLFIGRRFAEADELPLSDARRVSRRVRVAYVSRIPESKKALMQARVQARTADARPVLVDPQQGTGVTVSYGDARPRATIRFAPRGTPAPKVVAPPEPAEGETISTAIG